MRNLEYAVDSGDSGEGSAGVKQRGLHRLATVRRLQRISRRRLAQRMKVEVAEIRRQEEQSNDLPLSVLYDWQKALNVPIAELLVEPADALSRPLMQRAQLVRLMKTALALLEQSGSKAVRATARKLVDGLIEVMPELRGIRATSAVGKRRRRNELGVTATRTLPDDLIV